MSSLTHERLLFDLTRLWSRLPDRFVCLKRSPIDIPAVNIAMLSPGIQWLEDRAKCHSNSNHLNTNNTSALPLTISPTTWHNGMKTRSAWLHSKRHNEFFDTNFDSSIQSNRWSPAVDIAKCRSPSSIYLPIYLLQSIFIMAVNIYERQHRLIIFLQLCFILCCLAVLPVVGPCVLHSESPQTRAERRLRKGQKLKLKKIIWLAYNFVVLKTI